jgi:cobalamin synthase
MKTALVIALVLLGMLALAALQDEPLQVWLLILAPFALVVLALVVHIVEYSKPDRGSR